MGGISIDIHHVGYLVSKIDDSIKIFERLGYKLVQPTVYDSIRDINIAFIKKESYLVELIEPVSESSVVYKLQKKIGNSPYHICYVSYNYKEDLGLLLNQGAIQLGPPNVAVALNNKRVTFVMLPLIGMIELIDCSEDLDGIIF